MNANGEKDNLINAILKDAHSEIQPFDSWEALRARIDERVYGKNISSVLITQISKNAAFWRRIALAMAACLIITSTLLIYILAYTRNYRQRPITTANEGLLSQAQLDRLSIAFSHVRQLFGQHSPWMVIDSGGEGEIGVDNQIIEAVDTNKVIIIRLAVNMENQKTKRRYFDVVTFSKQQVSFRISVANGSEMGISLKPMITNEGKIAVEISAQADSGSQAGGVETIADNLFTSLVRLWSNGSWVNIDAVGQSVSNI